MDDANNNPLQGESLSRKRRGNSWGSLVNFELNLRTKEMIQYIWSCVLYQHNMTC